MGNYIKYLSQLYRPPLEKSDRSKYICLDKNEPPFSACEIIDCKLDNNIYKKLVSYPDPFPLYAELAGFSDVDIDNILLTNGSEQALEFIFRLLLQKDDEVIYQNPSFAMFDVFSYYLQAKSVKVDFDMNLKMNIDMILRKVTNKTKVVVLANPNNPTGFAFTYSEIDELRSVLERKNIFLVLDEAYFYFYNINSVDFIKKYSNIFITRTFSKALGVAGARIGYAISSKDNIELLRKFKPIDELNTISIEIGLRVLSYSREILKKNISQVEKWKTIFEKQEINNFLYCKTKGNFVLARIENTKSFVNKLKKENILIKSGFDYSMLENHIRFSISNDQNMNKVLNLLVEHCSGKHKV
jgi:histidinol-phosphate aminotransferase